MDNQPEWAGQLLERLDKVETMLGVLVERQQTREWYTTSEFAKAVGKAEFTIREYAASVAFMRRNDRAAGEHIPNGSFPRLNWIAIAAMAFFLSKNLLDRIGDRLGIQVPVATPHGLSLMANKLINNSLVNALIRQS